MGRKKKDEPKTTNIVPGTGKTLILSGIKCKDCKFFKKHAFYSLPGDDQKRQKVPCKHLGILENSKPCKNYSVDPDRFSFNDDEDLNKALRLVLSTVEKKNIPVFAALINQEQNTRKRGLYYGQPVFIKLYPDDYLSNYAMGWVINATKDYVFIEGREGFRATIFHKSVLTEKQFAKVRKDLRTRKLFKDPKLPSYTRVKIRNKDLKKEDYIPKTIDEYNEENNKKAKKKKGKLSVNIRGFD